MRVCEDLIRWLVHVATRTREQKEEDATNVSFLVFEDEMLRVFITLFNVPYRRQDRTPVKRYVDSFLRGHH